MNIVVLCGGLSMERNVSLSSGTLICGALRKLGHRAVMVDMFYGLEDYDVEPARLSSCWTRPAKALIWRPCAGRESGRAPARWARGYLSFARWRTSCSWRCTAPAARTAAYRPRWI